jgi:hypothetical protein
MRFRPIRPQSSNKAKGQSEKGGHKSFSFSKNERNLYVKTPNFSLYSNLMMRQGYNSAEMGGWLRAGKRIIFIYIYLFRER